MPYSEAKVYRKKWLVVVVVKIQQKKKCKKHALQLGPHFDPFKAKKACVWRTKRFEAVPVAAANAHAPHWAILTQLTNFPSNDVYGKKF